MEGNPAAGISSPGGREKPKERNLTDDEIKAVCEKLEADSTPPTRALQLILLTGQRPGEVVGLQCEELNLTEKLGEMLIPGHLIDRITNHKPIGITDRVYSKYDYLKEKQEALNAWGSRLARLVSGYELVKAENSDE